MRKVNVFVNSVACGELCEIDKHHYRFTYYEHYQGPPISLTMPLLQKRYEYNEFPAVFDGLLPEGVMLHALLKKAKLDYDDYLGQLIAVGRDCIGAITIEEIKHD